MIAEGQNGQRSQTKWGCKEVEYWQRIIKQTRF
jgi:hypothetical protein